jgi:hypothetical protein
VGKEVGEHLVEVGVEDEEAQRRLLSLLEHCQVGRIRADETIRIWGNRESGWTELLTAKWEEPGCFFSAVKDQHVREIRCIAMGDPYCEWEII